MKYDIEYIKPEIKHGYEITEHDKKVRSVQMNILKQIITICEKNGITYYAAGGTLIGTIRHEGYIPWDDDIDISMMRSDFNKFIEIAPIELQPPFHFKTTATEKGFFANSIYVSDTSTTCVRLDNPNNSTLKFDQGISVGITVMDLCNPNIKFVTLLRKYLHFFSALCNIYTGIHRTKWTVFIRLFLKLLYFDPIKIWKKQHSFLTKYNSKWKNSEKVVTLMPIVQKLKRVIWYKEDFSSTIKMPFENMIIDVPIGYHRILKGQFGNYMEFPPLESRISKHKAIFEPDIPYKDYCKNKFGVIYD